MFHTFRILDGVSSLFFFLFLFMLLVDDERVDDVCTLVMPPVVDGCSLPST